MKISIITLFPRMIESFLSESMVGKAQKNGQVAIELINLRNFAKDTYGTVDDRPYGGGAGMVLRVDVLYACLKKVVGQHSSLEVHSTIEDSSIDVIPADAGIHENSSDKKSDIQANDGQMGTEYRKKNKIRIILTSAKGATYSQAKAEKFAQKYEHLVIICGHYEGVDERIMEFVDEEISIGQYVLTGGELPAAIIADSVVRLIPGVLKKDDAARNESYSLIEKNGKKSRSREHAHYTRPAEFMGMKVPDVLMSGDHKEIEKWRKNKE